MDWSIACHARWPIIGHERPEDAAMDINELVAIHMLGWAVLLGVVQLVLSVAFNVGGRGLTYGVGARDDPPKPLGKIASRAERAYRNFIETFAFFAAAVFVTYALGKATASSAFGAELYLWSRVLYAPLYILGVPWLRTLAWTASIVAIVVVWSAAGLSVLN